MNTQDHTQWLLWDVDFEKTNEEFYVSTAGYQICPPGHKNERFPEYYILCFVKSGYCQFCRGNLASRKKTVQYHVGPGECFLMRPGEFSCYIAGETEPWVNAWISFDGRKTLKYLNCTNLVHTPVMKVNDNIYEDIRILTNTALRTNNPDLMSIQASAVLWKMMSHLTDLSSISSQEPKRSEYTTQTLYFIHHKYADACSIADIASELNISREYLYMLFKNDIGISPSKYLLEFRIERACVLLETSNCPINQIAQYTGFNSETYFSRKFKEIMGTSPKEYRKNYIQNPESAE